MKFEVGSKVILTNVPKWYGGVLKLNDICTIIEMGSPSIMWVCNTSGKKAPIYKSWATFYLKDRQLMFNFMD